MDHIQEIDGLAELVHYDAQGPFLIGGRCESCQSLFFPKQWVCPHCTGQKIEHKRPLSRRGTLYTYAAVHQKPFNYNGPVPYVIGRVLLPEGVFVLTQIKADLTDLEIGMDMELVVEPIFTDPNGCERTGYKFQPVSAGQNTI